MTKSTPKVSVVIPSWNAKDDLVLCIESLLAQSLKTHIIVVDNGSTDGSCEAVSCLFPQVEIMPQSKNLGFAGGVNVGIRQSLAANYDFVALFNNDAVAENDWLEKLLGAAEKNVEAGIITCKFMRDDKTRLDSTGDMFSNWGLAFARGRDKIDLEESPQTIEVFGATGGATLYRIAMLREIGLFDEDFFAYYEDVDISFRAQLAGWKVIYEPSAVAYHKIGTTSSKIKGFTTYQTMKNLPLVTFKNVPRKYLWRVTWRLTIARTLFLVRAISRGQAWPAIKGDAMATYLLITKLKERKRIQATKKVSDEYIWSIITHDLPPNATALRKLRARWWKLTGKNT